MHPTAIARTKLSRPMEMFTTRLLNTHLDYGCGRGDDVRLLRDTYDVIVDGFDPNNERFNSINHTRYDTVSLIYVLNVIEDLEERVSLLQLVYALAENCLLIACRTDKVEGDKKGDGVVTSRGTFQTQLKSKAWLRFLSDTLGKTEEIADGVFIVTKQQ